MIPRIGARGHSFKGAGQYFLHDKKADTNKRVAWTHTHNLPTENPQLAMKVMAFTAINRNRLKQEAGVALTGRKGLNQPVYTFSLGWSPDQEPEANHMREKALGALELLGLKNHEAVFVAHNDTAHPHVHAIVNLVDPENGKTLRPQNDRLKLSTWAEAYEKEHGKIYCEQRIINNEERRQGKKVKHRSDKVEKAATIQNIYNQTKDAQTFQKALEDHGYTLALGDRRGYVLVEKDGKVSSLSRQLKGQRAKELKAKLAHLSDLPNGQTLSEERQYFLRDEYETDRQKKIVDAAIETVNKIDQPVDKRGKTNQRKKVKGYKSFADEIDAYRNKTNKEYRVYLRKEKQIRDFYKRDEYELKLKTLNSEIAKSKNSKEKGRLIERLGNLKKTIADIDTRMQELGISPRDPAKINYDENPVKKESLKQSQDNLNRKNLSEPDQKKRNNGQDQANGLDLDR